MSEYQYYEFQAVDHRLSEKQMKELRAISTRARITPTSFTNEYDFGNFKGDADLWMEKYFDGYLYLANWGTREVQLAIPANQLLVETALLYCSNRVASSRTKSGRLIFTFCYEEEADGEWLEPDGHLSSFLRIREELAQGDLRGLYLGWLMGVQAGEFEDSEKEPPVPPNLSTLSGPQQGLADFFRLDPNLLAVAAQNSPSVKVDSANSKDLAAWVASLPSGEKDKMLVKLMEGDGSGISLELQTRFRHQRDASRTRVMVKPRTVAELLSATKT